MINEAIIPGPPEWVEQATCGNVISPDLDPDIFFPDRGGSFVAAKEICVEVCPVQAQCFQYAMDNDLQYGVWGGVGSDERMRMRQRRNRLGIK